ncbi:unnamed protein product, partial [Effrenium voratum]
FLGHFEPRLKSGFLGASDEFFESEQNMGLAGHGDTETRPSRITKGGVTTREARVAMLTNVFRQDIGFHDNP